MRFKTDLNWLINSPDLLQLDADLAISPLLKSLKIRENFTWQPTYRLGVYFEQLWHHLVRTSDEVELIAQNLQVIIDKQTLGEFDSIIGLNDANYHCELAVKFYLQIGNGHQLSDWVGPNLKDRFDDKYQKLFAQQLALSSNSSVRQWLQERSIVIDNKKLLTRGRLFYPYQEFIDKNFSYPNEVNSKHAKGFWIDYGELDLLLATTSYDWYQLPRFYWLAEIEQIDEQLLKVETEFSGFSLQKIVALKNGKEVMRGFVVNNDWLDKAQQRVKD